MHAHIDLATVKKAALQLSRSERGQVTCKLLHAFLNSNTVQFLDGPNSNAVALLTDSFMNGDSEHARAVLDALQAVIDAQPWLKD